MKVTSASIMKFILASSADLCQPDLINIGRGPLRAIKLLGKIQEDACFLGHYFHIRLLLTQMVLIVVHYKYH